MKAFLLVASFTLAMATEFNMKIDEEGKKFVEKVKIDEKKKMVEIVVPAHRDRAAIDVLKDFNAGLSATKRDDLKTCFIELLNAEDESPKKVEMSMRQSMAKFPQNRFMVVNKKSISIGELSKNEVSEKIAKHCKGYKLMRVISFVTNNINDAVLKLVKGTRNSKRSKRDATVTKFIACNNKSTQIAETCPQSRLAASCRFLRNDGRTCTYTITCRMTDTGFRCIGVHTFNTPQCCDFICQ